MVVACSGFNAPLTYPLTEAQPKDAEHHVRYATAPSAREWGLPEVVTVAKPAKLALPAKEAQLSAAAKASTLYRSLSAGARAALLYQGFVTRTSSSKRIGEAYAGYAASHTPAMLTLDALARQTERALEALTLELDRHIALPATMAFLGETTDALERLVVPVDLEDARRELLETFCAARRIADSGYDVPKIVGAAVSRETKGAGAGVSAARAYLATHAFSLDGNVGEQRRHLRAAWLLGHLLHSTRYPVLRAAWEKAYDRSNLWFGEPVSWSPIEASAHADESGLGNNDFGHAADVTRVDNWRAQLAKAPFPPRTFYLYGRYAVYDDRMLARPLAPRVGGRTRPSTLDISYVFGSEVSLLDLELLGREGSSGYAQALDPLRAEWEHTPQHDGVYASWLSALRAMTLRSRSAVAEPYSATSTHDARLTQSALAAWTVGRKLLTNADDTSPEPKDSFRASASDVDALVELHPEAIAHLAATVQQARKAAKHLAGDIPLDCDPLLKATYDMLLLALNAANARAQGAALDDAYAHELTHLARRLIALDQLSDSAGVSSLIKSADTVELGAHIPILNVAAGDLRDALFLVPDASSGKWVLRAGVVVPHEEARDASGARTEHPMVGTYFVGEK